MLAFQIGLTMHTHGLDGYEHWIGHKHDFVQLPRYKLFSQVDQMKHQEQLQS